MNPWIQPAHHPLPTFFGRLDSLAKIIFDFVHRSDAKSPSNARVSLLIEIYLQGLGKTLICLSTILATKGHWPSIPPEFSLGRHPVRPHTASLMQMAATAMGHEQIPWRKLFQDLARQGEEHRNCVKVLEDNIGSYYIPSTIISRRKSGPTEQKGKTIRLSNITLIVVPQNLLSQWMVELEKHFEEGSFVTLFVESNDSRMPSAQKLLKYDIIIMSRSRFLSEMFPNGTVPARVSSKGGCKCSLDEDCHCTSSAEYQSPLKDLHFLRIIMDEGHEFSSGKKTQTYWALSKIHVERKWIVSGTPTSGLMGVEVGTAAHETSKMSATDVNLSETLAARRYEPGFVQEKKDLEALRVLVVGFLHLKPWSNSKGDDPASWTTYIMPKDECRKPASLKALLQSLVVRHRIEDIEIDVQLPPLHNKVVYLQPSWHDKISINLFILTLIVNAVTSERSDEDYMFHAKNRQVLNRLINNLRQSGFYWTSFTQEDISKTLGVARQYLEHHPNPAAGCAISDRLLLEEAVSVGEIVLASPSWKALSSLHEMGLFVDGFTEACNKAWSLVLGQQREPMLIGATQLTKAQKWVDRHLYLSAESLERDLEGVGTKTMKKSWREVFGLADEVTQDPPTKANLYQSPKTKRPAHLMAPRLTARLTVSRARPALAILETEKLQKRNAQTADPANGPKLKSAMKTTSRISTKPITLETPIIRSTLRGTASAKLSYLLDRVIALHSEEKIMIFYEGDQIAYYIAQALEILDIRFLIYTRTLDLSLKNAYIATFNATSTFRVMLMNIHEAAHGLHIASASRVFFVNPVWQPNVEAQAIKRAHRIGQTRPVYVETLVLKDTLEDQMLQRRKGMTAQEHLKAEKSLLDDDTMSSIIRNARLIPLPQNDLHAMSAQVADLQKSQPLFGQSNTGVSETEDPYADLIFPVETPKAVRKSRERLARSLKTQAASQDGPKRKNEWDDSSDLEESSGPTKRRRLASVSVETGPGRKRVGFALDGAMEIDSLSGSNNATGESASIVSPP